MFNGVPLGGAARVVANGDRQAVAVAQAVLEAVLQARVRAPLLPPEPASTSSSAALG